MNSNVELWYVVYVKVGDPAGVHNIGLLNQHPIDFVIEKNNEVIVLYSIEITEEQGKKLADIFVSYKND